MIKHKLCLLLASTIFLGACQGEFPKEDASRVKSDNTQTEEPNDQKDQDALDDESNNDSNEPDTGTDTNTDTDTGTGTGTETNDVNSSEDNKGDTNDKEDSTDSSDDNSQQAPDEEDSSNTNQSITIISPTENTLLTSKELLLEFSNAENGWLYIGSSKAANDIFDGRIEDIKQSFDIPLNGQILHITLWTLTSDTWTPSYSSFQTLAENADETGDANNDEQPDTEDEKQDNTDKDQDNTDDNNGENTSIATLLHPKPNAQLSSEDVSITISELSNNFLYIGTHQGASDLFNSELTTDTTQVNIPMTGDTVYITLWTLQNGKWLENSYTLDTVKAEKETDELPTSDNENLDYTNNHLVDMLILFTDNAAQDRDIQAWSETAISTINQIMKNSQVNIRMRLAKATMAPAELNRQMTEHDPAKFTNNQNLLNMRAQYGADIVAIIPKNGEVYCGVSNIPIINPSNWSILHKDKQFLWMGVNCGFLAFAHETGHAFGLNHSVRENAPVGNTPWGRGYGIDNRFVTTMGYSSSYGVGNSPIFSNPQLNTCDENHVCGIEKGQSDSADASFLLNKIAPELSNLQTSILPAPAPRMK